MDQSDMETPVSSKVQRQQQWLEFASAEEQQKAWKRAKVSAHSQLQGGVSRIYSCTHWKQTCIQTAIRDCVQLG